MSFEKRITFEMVRDFPFSSIESTFTPFGDPFANPIRWLSFTNGTNGLISISFDGENDNFIFTPDFLMIVESRSFSTNEEDASFPIGTQMFIKKIGTVDSGSFFSTPGFTK